MPCAHFRMPGCRFETPDCTRGHRRINPSEPLAPARSPRPPYFVTKPTGRTTVERLIAYATDPRVSRLLGIFASALRG